MDRKDTRKQIVGYGHGFDKNIFASMLKKFFTVDDVFDTGVTPKRPKVIDSDGSSFKQNQRRQRKSSWKRRVKAKGHR